MKTTAPTVLNPYFTRAKFGDHDELSSLIQGGNSEFIQRGPGPFTGEFEFVGLDAGTLQFGRMDVPYLGRGESRTDRIGFLLHLEQRGKWLWRGQTLDPRSLIALAPRAEIQDTHTADSFWAFLSFDPEPLGRALSALTGSDEALIPHGTRLFLPQVDTFDLLRRRLRAVQAAVNTDPTLLAVPEARRGVEESVLSVLSRVLDSASRVRPSGYGTATRTRLARRVEDYLEANKWETVHLAHLCAVAGVSERTLRYIFQELYGMSPVRYLKLRRLHQVRRALRRADSDLNTVQDVANRCGIWHLGRFAAEYRGLFGESPLETLRRTGDSGKGPRSLTGPWRALRNAVSVPGIGGNPAQRPSAGVRPSRKPGSSEAEN